MAHIDWRMKGRYIKNCNCAYGCPCDFNALPNEGHCEGMHGMQIDEGHFGDVDLTGVKWAGIYHWPGPLHEGNGTYQPVIDESATEAQRNAMLTIMTGQEQVEGTFWHIASMIVSKIIDPAFVPIEFECNVENRTARMSAPGLFETVTEPIKNPVTGGDHRVQTSMPEGFEYTLCEIASASVNKGMGEIKYDWPNGHSSVAHVEHTTNGLAR